MDLVERLMRTCRRRSDATAIVDPLGQVTFKQVAEQVVGMAAVAAARDDQPRVGVMLPTTAAFPAAFFGCLAAGKTPVPLNFLLAGPELAAVVADAGLQTIITCDVFAEAAGQLGCQLIRVEDLARLAAGEPVAPASPSSVGERHTSVCRPAGRLTPPARRGSRSPELAALLYTSGTTGKPKGVELTSANLIHDAEATIEHARLTERYVWLSVLPLFHAFGMTASMILPLLLGAKSVYVPTFSGPAVLEAIATHRISVIMTVASMFGALVRAKATSPHDSSSLELCVSGGEPLPRPIAEAFEQAFGIPLLEGYGLTETSPVVSINVPGRHRPGTTGQPIPGVRFRVVNDQGRDVPTGQDGEVLIAGPVIMRGYFNRPEETAAVLDADGWFRSGDLGRLDEDGYLTITGRKKELIICGGANIYPREVEEALLAHPDVEIAAVVGMADTLRGEVPKAFVVLRPGADVGEVDLREWCRTRLATYKVPRRVELREELPRAPSGKVLKSQLA